MKRVTSIQDKYIEASTVLRVAFKYHYVLWITGKLGRHKQTERALPALVKKGFLHTFKYGKRLVYATSNGFVMPPRAYGKPDPTPAKLSIPYHELGCSETLVRFMVSDRSGEAIPENVFRASRLGCIPDWAIRYDHSAIMAEFSTYGNVYARGNIASKITKYNNNMWRLEAALGRSAIVVFILDVPKKELRIFFDLLWDGSLNLSSFYFVDYETFLSVPIGDQLTSPIYVWGGDGQSYPLRNVQPL